MEHVSYHVSYSKPETYTEACLVYGIHAIAEIGEDNLERISKAIPDGLIDGFDVWQSGGFTMVPTIYLNERISPEGYDAIYIGNEGEVLVSFGRTWDEDGDGSDDPYFYGDIDAVVKHLETKFSEWNVESK